MHKDVNGRPQSCPPSQSSSGPLVDTSSSCSASPTSRAKESKPFRYGTHGKSFSAKMADLEARAHDNRRGMVAAEREYWQWASKVKAEAPCTIDHIFRSEDITEEMFLRCNTLRPLKSQERELCPEVRRPQSAASSPSRNASPASPSRPRKVKESFNHEHRDAGFNSWMQDVREQLKADVAHNEAKLKKRTQQQRAASAGYRRRIKEIDARLRTRPLLVEDEHGEVGKARDNASPDVASGMFDDSAASHAIDTLSDTADACDESSALHATLEEVEARDGVG